MSVIKSGSNGNVADVNEDSQLLVKSISESELEFVSEEKGNAYSWSSSFATGGTDVDVIYVENTSQTMNLVIDQIVVGAADACVFTLKKVTSGTASGTTVTGRNLNLGNGNSAPASAFGDAAVSGSLTGDTMFYDGVAANEFEVLDTKGGLVVTQDKALCVTASANTTVYVTVIGHFKDK